MPNYRVSIDVGGTFTDLVALDEETGDLVKIKVSSTPRKPVNGVLDSFQEFLREVEPEKITLLVHATTLAVNALLGQLGLELPKVALITTKGFKDIIEIGRQRRHKLYDLFVQRPRILVPRKFRYEVYERVGPTGEVLEPLDFEKASSLMTKLKQDGVEAVAIVLLHSYINPKHEKEVEKLVKETYPEAFLSLSSEIAPVHREFERMSTAVVNACLMPIVSEYINDLFNRTRELGVFAPLCVMQSDGGIASKDYVVEKPVSIIESGPAAGVVASSFYGKLLQIENLISFDMGGTTAKAGIVRGGISEVVTEYEVAGEFHSGRILKGSGYPVKGSFIDLAECSAGGGTIAWADSGGALRVGPLSAGADPGPACYGKGGDEPTVTDANLVLGRLNQEFILGGRMRIFSDLSQRSIKEKICRETGLGLDEAAAGIIRIVNSKMAKILRMVSVERGHDPRQFTLCSFGGAGPMHACALAEELNVPRIIVPINPGLFSAYGLLTADFTCSLVSALMKKVKDVDLSEIQRTFERMRAKGIEILEHQRFPPENIMFLRQLDMRYSGQGYELTVPVFAPSIREGFERALENFHDKHEAIYGYAVQGEEVELINARILATRFVAKPKLKVKKLLGEKPPQEATKSRRYAFFEKDNDYANCPVYDRRKLKSGNRVSGPAIIEQYDATTVVYPDWEASVDQFGSLLISHGGGRH